jgi:shikimate kinase
MLVHLVGPIAAGKSTFAKWFAARQPTWAYVSIDDARLEAAAEHGHTGDALLVEDKAWEKFFSRCQQDRLVMESCGALHRMDSFLTDAIKTKRLYTIKFVAPYRTLAARVLNRPRTNPWPYNASELESLYELCRDAKFIPADLTIDTSSSNINLTFDRIEKYILEAAKRLN